MMLYYKDKKGSALVIVQASALAVGVSGLCSGVVPGSVEASFRELMRSA